MEAIDEVLNIFGIVGEVVESADILGVISQSGKEDSFPRAVSALISHSPSMNQEWFALPTSAP